MTKNILIFLCGAALGMSILALKHSPTVEIRWYWRGTTIYDTIRVGSGRCVAFEAAGKDGYTSGPCEHFTDRSTAQAGRSELASQRIQ